ncbi:uncharacterized protein LOC119579525 [Penaeus monodon]|uniref:uncharacterized protein LOC119579525 n=1 Tax=Penaeus monodon TaxID=6687 RepID=UPI0018A6FA44|nr:uncharacterized protein LOC119579525 [Penaeus monodon]
MRLLRLYVLCLGVCLSAAGGDEQKRCVITEMKNKIEKLTKETLGKPLYLWSGPSLSSVTFVLFLRNNSGGDEASETVNLKNETQLLLKRWTTIEFSTTKANDTDFPTVSIPAINETHILRNCSNCSLKELQIQVEGSALFALNCSDNTDPQALFADHWEEAETAAPNSVWKISSLLLLPICFLSILCNIWTSVKHRRRSAEEIAHRQEDDLPLVSHGAQNLPLVSHGAQNLPLVSHGAQNLPLVSLGAQNLPLVSLGAQNLPLVSLGAQNLPLVSLGAQDLPPPVPPPFLKSPPEGAVMRERGMREHHDDAQSTESENVYEEAPEGATKVTILYESVNSICGALP